MWRKREHQTDPLQEVTKRLREERPEVDPLRLDQIKTTAMARAGAARRAGSAGRRLVAGSLVIGLMAAGTGGVLAAGGGGNVTLGAVQAQYSSPTSTQTVAANNGSKKKTKAKAKPKAKAKKNRKSAAKRKIIPRFTG